LPLVGYASYAGTKHAMSAFHHSVAIEERKSPIVFSIIHPPSTRTPMLEQEMADPTSVIAFAEKSYSPEDVAKVIIDAIRKKPVEVVFPPVAGRLQRMVGYSRTSCTSPFHWSRHPAAGSERSLCATPPSTGKRREARFPAVKYRAGARRRECKTQSRVTPQRNRRCNSSETLTGNYSVKRSR